MGAQKNQNLKWGFVFISLFLSSFAQAEIVDRIIATVNQDPVTLYDLNKAMDNINKELSKAPTPKLSNEEYQSLRKRAFDHLLDETLLNQEVSKKAVETTDQEVNHAIQTILERNQFSLDQLKKELASKGSSFDAYREEIKGQLKRLKFINQIVGNKIHVSDEDVKAFYAQNAAQLGGNQEVHIAQIVFPFSENPSEGDLKKAQANASQAYQKIKGGAKFDQVMKEYGGEGSGDLGKVNFMGINPELSKAIQGLQEGGVTEPVRSSTGFIIVKLLDKPEAPLSGSEQMKENIRDKIYEIKVQQEIKKYVDQLRSKAFIDVKATL